MRIPVMLAAAVLGAAAPNEFPVRGVWRALPSAGVLGPDHLELSEKFIIFGNNREAVLKWTTAGSSTRILTQSGTTYVFNRQNPNRICLMASFRMGGATPDDAAFPIRCFQKDSVSRSE
jgi:hypothetical protein